MDHNALVRLIGFPATLIHGDTLVLDRWLWLKARLPRTNNPDSVIDIGCGTGAFSIGAARRGYEVVGLSWDRRNQETALERAALCNVTVDFPIQDVRVLGGQAAYKGRYDIAICTENVEHIIEDERLVIDIAATLKPGGFLLLTTPNYYYREIAAADRGPFCVTETGWHVRRGYTAGMLRELCDHAGLVVEEIGTCSGFFSQKVTWLLRLLLDSGRMRPAIAWALVLPFRILPLLFDRLIARVTSWPDFSICLVAYKPRRPDPRGKASGEAAAA